MTHPSPTFKTKALRLVNNEGWLKRLLLQYKQLIQPYLSLLWLYWRRISLLGPRLSMTSMARGIKQNRKAAAIIQPIILSQNHTTSFL